MTKLERGEVKLKKGKSRKRRKDVLFVVTRYNKVKLIAKSWRVSQTPPSEQN